MSDPSPTNEVDKSPRKTNLHDTENDKESNAKSSSVTKSPRVSSVVKKQQKEAEKAEKLRLKEEKEKQKLEEKMKKEKEKSDLKLKKESERLEKEREKEEKRKQKEEEKRIRHEQIEEEKKKKEEAKQEERKKKEEEKRKEEERMEKKSQKEKELMKNFFIKATKDAAQIQQNATTLNEVGPFMPFEVKPEMRLAPLVRFDVETAEERRSGLDKAMSKQVCSGDYLHELRSGLHKPGRSTKTWPQDEEVEIVPVESVLSAVSAPSIERKMKLIQFHDNYRPAYYGTWSKVSSVITPRQPLAKDSTAFDYEVDSDEEWEEEEPGESISHSEGEEDGLEEDAGNDDNEDKFFVPHGYLSEGEGCDGDDEEDLSPEALKQKQQIRARNWEVEMKENVERLRPISIGVIKWHEEPKFSEDQLGFLKKFTAQPIDVTFPIMEEDILKESAEMTNMNKANNKRLRVQGVPEEAMPDLIRLVHGCASGIDKMCKEFKSFWTKSNSEAESEDSEKSTISKRQLEAKIREIASYQRDSTLHSYKLWHVAGDVLEKYGLADAPLPSQWKWSVQQSAKKPPQIGFPTCETPKHDKTLKEMKTPKVSASPVTPSFSGTRKNPSISGSIKKFMTPMADAVSSERSAKRRVCTTFLSGPAPSPGENANLSSSFVSRSNQRKRSSSGDVVSESKRMKNELVPDREESSQDCVIVEGPLPVVNGNKKLGSCFVQLFRCNAENGLKVDSDLKDVPMDYDDDDDVRITDHPDENIGAKLKLSQTSEATVRSKTLTNFFKTLSPLNK